MFSHGPSSQEHPGGFVRLRHFGFLALSQSKGSPTAGARSSSRGVGRFPPCPAAFDPTRVGGPPLGPPDGGGHRAVPGVSRGASADRRRLPAGPPPSPSPRHLMSPPSVCRPSTLATLRCVRRDWGMCLPRLSWLSGRPCRPRSPSVHPRSLLLSLRLTAASPFPRPPGSDTIPIASRPAVQFNPFYPAGQFPWP